METVAATLPVAPPRVRLESMNSDSYVRFAARVAVCVAASLAAPASFGAEPDRAQVQAQLLDHAEFLCANCFFGASKHFYCFQADNQILIGYQKVPVFNFEDQSKNYLTSVRPRWTVWTAPGQTVPISYDDRHIWVTRPEPKEAPRGIRGHLKGAFIWTSRGESQQVRLKRSSIRDIFISSDACRGAAGAKSR